MKRRRGSNTTDSLDMLLDALCNMFGGIIFIALLVAVMSGEQSDQTADAAPPPPTVRSLEVKTLTHQLQSLKSQVQELQQDDPNAWQRLELHLAEREDTQATIERLNSIVDDIESRTPPVEIAIAQATREVERLEQLERTLEDARDNPDLATITDAIEQETQAVVHLEQQLQIAAKRRTVNARLSLERAANGLTRLFVIVANDRAWIALADHRPPETDDVLVELNFNREGCDRYSPRSTGGFQITEEVGSHPRFLELLSKYSKDDYYVFMIVSPSGHGGFATLKAALLSRQYRHNVHLADDLEPVLILCPGSPTFSTQ